MLAEILAPFGGIAFLTDAGEDRAARSAMLAAAEAVITWFPGQELGPGDVKGPQPGPADPAGDRRG